MESGRFAAFRRIAKPSITELCKKAKQLAIGFITYRKVLT